MQEGDFYHAPLAFRKSKSRLNLLNLYDALLSRVNARPRGPLSVRMNFAIVVPDDDFARSKSQSDSCQLLNSAAQKSTMFEPAEFLDFI